MSHDHYLREGDPQYDTDRLDDLFDDLLHDGRFADAVLAAELMTGTTIELDGLSCDLDRDNRAIVVWADMHLQARIAEHETSDSALLQLANVYRVFAVELERQAGSREPEPDRSYAPGWLEKAVWLAAAALILSIAFWNK